MCLELSKQARKDGIFAIFAETLAMAFSNDGKQFAIGGAGIIHGNPCQRGELAVHDSCVGVCEFR
jgi:hypothetical protein